jgi:hypothetical protein
MLDITTENVTTDAEADDVREVEKLFEQLEAQPAQIEDADKVDAKFQRLSAAPTGARRAALLTLEKSGRELIDSVTSDRGWRSPWRLSRPLPWTMRKACASSLR